MPITLTPEEKDERIKLLHLEAMELADRLNPSWDDSVESVALAREHVLHIAPDEEVDGEAATEVYGDIAEKRKFIELFIGERKPVPVESQKSADDAFSQRELDLTVELLLSEDWAFLEKKILAPDHGLIKDYYHVISERIEDLGLYFLVRKKNLKNIIKEKSFTDLLNVRKIIPHTNEHFTEVAMRFLYGAIAHCDRALAVHNGEAPLKTGDGAFPVAGAEALPGLSPAGTSVADPKVSQVIEEIVSAKTTPKSRKEPRWSEKTRDEFECKFNFILRFFGEETRLSEITENELFELMDIFNNRLPARRGKNFSELDPRELPRRKKAGEKIANATVEKWIVALKMILNRGNEYYPGALKIPYVLVKEEVTPPDKRQKIVRLPYSPSDLRALFGGNFAENALKGGKAPGTAAYFLCGALTGARAEELGQLRLEDIITDDGVLCFRIDGDAEIRTRVKNKASKRTTPVPKPLVRIIQLLMVGKSQEENIWGFARTEGQKATFSRNATRWWNGYVKDKLGEENAEQKLPDGRTAVKVFHSFRHTFATAAKEKNISKGYVSEILGHEHDGSAKNTTDHYQAKFSPSTLAPVMEEINAYHGIDWQAVAKKIYDQMVKLRKIS